MERYEVKHRGAAIVCGGSPSVFEDLAAARELRPHAVVLGVNFAAAVSDEIEHIWSQHNNCAEMYKERAGRKIYVHGRAGIMGNAVDYWWPELKWVSGSSGVAGALWARHGMGFDEVILAGVPLSMGNNKHGGHYPMEFFAEDNLIDGWQRQLKHHKLNGKTEGIYSMSGETRGILGAPPKE